MLSSRIRRKNDVRVAVIGIGYVGLPLAIKLAEAGFSVLGVDINQQAIDQLNSGASTVEGIKDKTVFNVIRETQKLSLIKIEEDPAKNSPQTLEPLMGVDVIVVCVPTPFGKKGWDPETSRIHQAAQLICILSKAEEDQKRLPKERLIVLESTTYPGTTQTFFTCIRDRFTALRKKCYLAYSPERTSPGPESHNDKSNKSTFRIPRVVGGIDDASTKIAKTFYSTIFEKIHPVADLETAEMTKLVENTFRFVSIGFANEIARIAGKFDLNIWEIIDAVKTKPFGLDICYPGLIGGHCLPIDPHYLGWAYRNHRNVATFVEVAEKSHQDARHDAVDLIQRLLSHHEKGLPKSSILFFGVAYKKNVGDIRESGALDLMKKLFSYGASISFWDPVYSNLKSKSGVVLSFSEAEVKLLPQRIKDSLQNYTVRPEELAGDWESLKDSIMSSKFDAIVFATDHQDYQKAYSELIDNRDAPPIVDINNSFKTRLKKLRKSGSIEEAERLAENLKNPGRYMLFGRD